MLNNTFSIPGTNEQQPSPEAFLENANNTTEVMDYINQIYDSARPEVVTQDQSYSSERTVNPGVDAYQQAAVAEALSGDQIRQLSMPEYLAAAPPEYQKERATNITRLVKAYRDEMVYKAGRSDYELAA